MFSKNWIAEEDDQQRYQSMLKLSSFNYFLRSSSQKYRPFGHDQQHTQTTNEL